MDSPETETDQARWFAEEVHPHESSLRSYLKFSFPSVRDVDDVVQESYLRLWRSAAKQRIRSARGFLFSVAQRLAIDHLRREKRSPHESVTDFHSLSVLDGGLSVSDDVSVRQEIALLAEAIDALPARCREITILRKLDGLSHREIAVRLGISEETVQVQIGRGMRKCQKFLTGRGLPAGGKREGPERP